MRTVEAGVLTTVDQIRLQDPSGWEAQQVGCYSPCAQPGPAQACAVNALAVGMTGGKYVEGTKKGRWRKGSVAMQPLCILTMYSFAFVHRNDSQ